MLFSLCDANPIGGNLLTTGDRLCKYSWREIMQILLVGKSYWGNLLTTGIDYANPIGGNYVNPIGGKLCKSYWGEIMQILLGVQY